MYLNIIILHENKIALFKVSARFIVIQTIKSLLVLRIYKCKIKKIFIKNEKRKKLRNKEK